MGGLYDLLADNDYDTEDFAQSVYLDGLDEACVAVTDDCRFVYDYNLIIQTLMQREKWSVEDAIDYADFNIVSAKFGDNSPIIVYKLYHNEGD